jgi:hypothetical protein
MPDGCKHRPPTNLGGFEVESFVAGPESMQSGCAVTPECDSSHIFQVRNFHLYDVDAIVDAESVGDFIEICDDDEDTVKRTAWKMAKKVPAAPYRPRRGAPTYHEERLSTRVHSGTDYEDEDQDVINVDYYIDSPVGGLLPGGKFNVPVNIV